MKTRGCLRNRCSEKQIGSFYGIFPGTNTTRKQDRTATIPLYHYQQPDDMQEAVCVLLDRFNSVYMQSRNTNPESNKLSSIFKCVAWLVFELLDLHPFSDGNGRLCRLLSSYVLSMCTLFPTPIYNLHTDHEFEKALIAGRKTRHPSTLTSMIIESSLVAWDYAV